MGKSGKHIHRQVTIRSTEDERRAWYETAAARGSKDFGSYARKLMNDDAKRVGFDPPEKLDDE